MQLLGLLAPILSLVAFVGFVWLVVVAFKRSALWGILVLLLSPITAVIFAIKYWQESKKPFLVYMGSCAGSVAIVVAMFTFLGGFEILGMAKRMQQGEEISQAETVAVIDKTMDRMENSGLLSEQEQADLKEVRQAFDEVQASAAAAEAQKAAAAMTASNPPVAQEEPRKPSVSLTVRDQTPEETPPEDTDLATFVPLRRAGEFVGQYVRAETKNGYEYEGRLAEVRSDGLRIDRHLPGGLFSIELERSDIRSLQLSRQ